jgi:hypothetical protein
MYLNIEVRLDDGLMVGLIELVSWIKCGWKKGKSLAFPQKIPTVASFDDKTETCCPKKTHKAKQATKPKKFNTKPQRSEEKK